MKQRLEILGMKFSRLVPIRLGTPSNTGLRRWECLCDCGKQTIVFEGALMTGNTKSCGCLRGEHHGQSRKKNQFFKEYRSWAHAKDRCNNQNDEKYPIYGGRGIIFDPEWTKSFSAFLEHLGPCPSGCSLDRIDVNGNYEPGNCRWATPMQQANNMRCNVRIQLPNGAYKTITEFAKFLGEKREFVYHVYRTHGHDACLALLIGPPTLCRNPESLDQSIV